jgi:acid stress chaperone HdeA
MNIKTLSLLVVAILLPASVFAADAKKHISKWTCQDYLVVEDTFKPKAIVEAIGYSKKMKQHTLETDVIGTDKITPEILVTECKKQPKATFWKKVTNEVKKLEKSVKSDVKKVEKKL